MLLLSFWSSWGWGYWWLYNLGKYCDLLCPLGYFVQRICTSLVAVRAGSVMCALAGLLRMTSAGCSRAMTSSRSQERPRAPWLWGALGFRKANDLRKARPAHGGHTTWSVWDTSYQILVPCSANNVARRAQGNLGCTGGRGVCTHAYSTQSESVRSMSDISVMGIILIIHAQSIPHLTQTKQDISSSHSSRQLWQILCGSWNNPILPSEVPRWMRCQWSPGASEMGNKVWIKKSATSAKKAWWLGITLSSIQQNYIIWQKIWINQVFKEIRNHQIVAMYGVTTRSA